MWHDTATHKQVQTMSHIAVFPTTTPSAAYVRKTSFCKILIMYATVITVN